jgi:C1A family cysteine protease
MRRKSPFILGMILVFFIGSFSLSSVLAVDNTAKAASNEEIEKTLAELRAEIKTNGYTYTVDYNDTLQYPLDQLCGFRPEFVFLNDDSSLLTRQTALPSTRDLPARYIGYYTPIKDQGSCGSCWAFAMAGTVEAQILRGLGSEVDISEQWLLDCNPWGWDCVGGNFNYWMFMSTGGIDGDCYPYLGYKTPCNHSCPYLYFVYDWDWVVNGYSVAPVNLIKEAIMEYGSVSVGIYASTAFHYYSGGIFNNCYSGQPDHAVILCGWDDSIGCWLLKNSWGPTWGGVDIDRSGKVDPDELGYMWITYGCNNVGFGASFPIPYYGGRP